MRDVVLIKPRFLFPWWSSGVHCSSTAWQTFRCKLWFLTEAFLRTTKLWVANEWSERNEWCSYKKLTCKSEQLYGSGQGENLTYHLPLVLSCKTFDAILCKCRLNSSLFHVKPCVSFSCSSNHFILFYVCYVTRIYKIPSAEFKPIHSLFFVAIFSL